MLVMLAREVSKQVARWVSFQQCAVHTTFQENQVIRWQNFKQGWMDRHNSVIRFWKRNHKGCKGLTLTQNFPNIQNKIFKEVSELMSQFNVEYEGGEAVSQLRWLVTSFSLRQPGFNPSSVHVGLTVDQVTLGHVFSVYFSFLYQFSSSWAGALFTAWVPRDSISPPPQE
jgi:hypothetical protein